MVDLLELVRYRFLASARLVDVRLASGDILEDGIDHAELAKVLDKARAILPLLLLFAT